MEIVIIARCSVRFFGINKMPNAQSVLFNVFATYKRFHVVVARWLKKEFQLNLALKSSVVHPDSLDPDPDPAFQVNPNPVSGL